MMKKIFIAILLLFSVQSFGQLKLYAERKNTDNTIDSFYTKGFLKDSVFNKQGGYVCPTVESFENTFEPVFPQNFGTFVKCADGIYRNVDYYSASGAYTPTLFNTTNVAASSANQCAWIRVGNVVYVTGTLSIDATAAASTLTELGLSLPVATDIVGAVQVSGNAASDAVASLSARIKGDAANNRATISFRSISTTNDTYSFTLSYTIL